MRESKQTSIASFCPDLQESQLLQEVRQKKDRQRGLKSELACILSRLDMSCMAGGQGFVWPDQKDLNRLNEVVKELRSLIRGGHSPVMKAWNNYKALDKHWPGLRLCSRIEKFLQRVVKNTPERPLEIFWRLAKAKGVEGKLAVEFVELIQRIHKGLCDAGSVQWDRFTPIFLRARKQQTCLKTRLKKATGAPELLAYAVYLEIENEDQAWIRQHWLGVLNLIPWVNTRLQNMEFLRRLERFCVGYDLLPGLEKQFKELPVKFRKEAVNERQRRYLAKKAKISPQKA